MEITRDGKGLVLTHRKYALALLKDIGFLSCKPATTPMETSVKLSHGDSELFEDNKECWSIVGKLIYLNITRPDLSFVVQQLSQFLDAPTVYYWKAMHRVLRYIKGAPGQGLSYAAENSLQLAMFSNSD